MFYEFFGWVSIVLVVTLTAFFGWSAIEQRRAWRRQESLPPDPAALRELAADLERLSRRVASFASRSDPAEKEHAGVT